MTKSYNKLKHQVKSSKYYLFWGAATIAVMAGHAKKIIICFQSYGRLLHKIHI